MSHSYQYKISLGTGILHIWLNFTIVEPFQVVAMVYDIEHLFLVCGQPDLILCTPDGEPWVQILNPLVVKPDPRARSKLGAPLSMYSKTDKIGLTISHLIWYLRKSKQFCLDKSYLLAK